MDIHLIKSTHVSNSSKSAYVLWVSVGEGVKKKLYFPGGSVYLPEGEM